MSFFEVACTGERGMVAFVQVSMNISLFEVGCTTVTWTDPLPPAARALELNGASVNRCPDARSAAASLTLSGPPPLYRTLNALHARSTTWSGRAS
jgi:hypothetical protein